MIIAILALAALAIAITLNLYTRVREVERKAKDNAATLRQHLANHREYRVWPMAQREQKSEHLQ